MEIKEIKRRVKSIREIRQITRAMQTVATFRLKRSQERIEAARPFARKISEVLVDVTSITREFLHPFMERRRPRRVCFVVFTADRSLCGAFNMNIIKKAMEEIRALESWQRVRIITVGKRGYNYFKRLPYKILAHYQGIAARPVFEKARELGAFLKEKYLGGEVDEVILVYSRFYGVLSQKPREYRLLPIVPVESSGVKERIPVPFIYEPSPREILEHLVLRYLEAEIFRAMLETDAGENGARMASMSASVTNAHDMEERLNHKYHQARQSIITNELAEISGGARAVEEK
ncbi:MAG: ATP synthase F1 subunit gamma [Bacillota bacterium]